MANLKIKSGGSRQETATAAPRRKAVRSVYSKAEIEEIFRRFSIQRPEPKGELEHVNPFTLVVAVALSAQATDVGVNKATRALFAIADTPQKMLDLGEERVRDHIKTIGLYRNKAKNVIALSQKLIDDFGGEVPQTREELMTLPGVGRKTANVVLGNAFGIPGITTDTHVMRLSKRLGYTASDDPLVVEKDLQAVLPRRDWTMASHRLIFHGRRTCHARKPACGACPVARLCPSFGIGEVDPLKAAGLVKP